MDVHIVEMAADAGRTLFTPGIIAGTVLGSLAFASGAAARVIELFETRPAGGTDDAR